MFRWLLLLALLLRIGAAVGWQAKADAEQRILRFGDSQTYWVLADKIGHGKPYDYAGSDSRIFRAPLYPIVLAPFTWLEERTGVFAARLLGAVLGTLVVAILYWSAQSLYGRNAGTFAAAFGAIYPGAIGMSVFILSEAVFVPLMLMVLVLLPRSLFAWFHRPVLPAMSTPQWVGAACWAGIASGLACLARPSWILSFFFLAGYGFLVLLWNRSRASSRDHRSRMICWLSIFGISMAVTMSPWWIRNYAITQRFVPTTLQVGASLYDGLHPGASGASDEGMAFTLPFEEELRREDRQAAEEGKTSKDVFEWRLNQRLFHAALRWADENRSDTLRLGMIKFAKMWNPWPTAQELGGVWIRIAEAVAYSIILGLTIIALVAVRDLRVMMGVFALPTIYFAILHTLFVGSVRYRQPAVVALCVVAGIGAAWMLERIRNRKSLPTNGER